jgi:uncharacterized protein YdeI (YjbR/CyaY-like superfamily)
MSAAIVASAIDAARASSATLGTMAADIPELIVPDAPAWRRWLGAHHASPEGVWLVLARKGTTQPTSLTYAQALDEALCHGWIDGQTAPRDGMTYRERFTPRRARSRWSARNVGIVGRLRSEGRMHPAGEAEVERAQADGRWDAAYAGAASTEVPSDLAAALRAQPRARAMFEILTSQNRYAILFRISDAKQPATRVRRIDQFVTMLARGETVYPQKRTL